jgi:hypothetical protein
LIENCRENHSVLFCIDLARKKIFFLDSKMDRSNISEDFKAFLSTIIEKIHLFFQNAFDLSEVSLESYPDHYYKEDESDFDCQIQVLTMIYFIEREVPIWYNDSLIKDMKLNFCAWLLKGYLPF